MQQSLTDNLQFSLRDIDDAANRILDTRPDPIPTQRLLSEVLRLPEADSQVQVARQAASQTRWVRQLKEAQLPDGSWGRFHTQDTKIKSTFRTSEEAIDRAFMLGMRTDEGVLLYAKNYVVKVLGGDAHISDWAERGDTWPVLIRTILQGRLAQIEPSNLALDAPWEYLEEVTSRSFASGQYSLVDEKEAFLSLSGIHMRRGFLHSQYALWILSARSLPVDIEYSLLKWIWSKPDGIGYIGAPLVGYQPRMITAWLRSMSILSRFPSWREVCISSLNALWKQRDGEGWWDFGSQTYFPTDFPISESWRKPLSRKVDYSTCILAFLRTVFD